ncbi:hypothetical protein [Reyranella sp.]|uniref:hypothetical protein n=1 Tax=Reyranella sp. TaxID=1929291 RepID=UPI002730DC17|nr:hypothetical protein [Reyranella sp.]MDP2374361.1 hypothetical protein [Reyranella sp.]
MPISANALVKRFMTYRWFNSPIFQRWAGVSPSLQEGKVPISIDLLVKRIKVDRCFSHPIFDNWAMSNPDPLTIAALFHQLQLFCSSTRQGWHFPTALKDLGLSVQGKLMTEIVDSESNHGSALAMMAGHIVNRSARRTICPNIGDQKAVERQLKEFSDSIFANSPGYNRDTGLTGQARQAVAVFERRKLSDRRSTYKNLGTTLALELVANQILIPGMKVCLVDSSLYGVTLDEPEMHYLLEHWGEIGAEQQHERKAVAAVATALNESTQADIVAGIDEFLVSLVRLLDVMNEALRASWLLRCCQSTCVCAR